MAGFTYCPWRRGLPQTVGKLERFPKPVRTVWGRAKSVAPSRESKHNSSVFHPVYRYTNYKLSIVSVTRMTGRRCEHWRTRRLGCLKHIYDILSLIRMALSQRVWRERGWVVLILWIVLRLCLLHSTDNVLEGSRAGSVPFLLSALYCIINIETSVHSHMHALSSFRLKIFCVQLNFQMQVATRMCLVWMSLYRKRIVCFASNQWFLTFLCVMDPFWKRGETCGPPSQKIVFKCTCI
jgi:hypothetical protein